ncbi:MAG: hypothetical protein BWX54_01821 [Verrucomicrobia bacterium ADurb.Bin018]|nr:MAG: hypothetical protein BWX54_01821 [Verrucomicrobia bacterium ADurb.Bin018]
MSLLLLLGNNYAGSTNSYPVRWYVNIDWDNDGTYSYDEAIYTQSVDIDRGRDGPFSDMRAGQLVLTLDNRTRRFDANYAAGALYGKLLPGRGVILRCTYRGTVYTLYTGKLVALEPSGKLGRQVVTMTFLDAWYYLSKDKSYMPIAPAGNTYNAIAMIASVSNVSMSADSDTTGGETYDYRWGEGEDHAEQITAFSTSNQGFLFVNKQNAIVFHERTQKDKLRTGHNWTLDEDALVDMSTDDPWANVCNNARVTATTITKAGGETLAFQLTEPIYVAPGSVNYFAVEFSFPIDASAIPGGTVNYTANSQANGLGADMTASMTWFLVNCGPYVGQAVAGNLNTVTGLWITQLDIYGYKLTFEQKVAEVDDSTSQAIYRALNCTINEYWPHDYADAETIANYLIDTYKAPMQGVTVRMQHKLGDMLQYELGDIIYLTADTYTIADYFRMGAIHLWTGRTMQEIHGEYKLEPTQRRNIQTRQMTWFLPSGLVTGASQSAEYIYRGETGTIKRVDAHVVTAPTGASIICDINIGGTSIWNSTQANRVTIAATEKAGTQTSFDTTTVSDGDVITMDIDQVGSTITGTQLTVLLEIESPLEVQ